MQNRAGAPSLNWKRHCCIVAVCAVAAIVFQDNVAAVVSIALVASVALVAIVSIGRAGERERSALEARCATVERDASDQARSKDAFFANLTHEIRTPMTSILGFAELLCSPTVVERDRRRFVDSIRTAGQHLLTIVNDMLDLAKIDAGRMTLERLALDPVAVSREVVNMLEPRATEKSIALRLRCVGAIPTTIHSDPVRLRQVLLNLCSNAVRFTDRGEVAITLRLERDGSGQAVVRFDVSDTGIGMHADELARLFKPFVQANSSTARRFGGSGLGLSIASKLVSLLGGTIAVESEFGRGSTFTFTVAAGSLEGVRLVTHQPDDDSARPRGLGAGVVGSVLLAEDSPDSQRLLAIHLKTIGVDAVVVSDGRKAVRAALASRSSRPFDLLLLDVHMPELDGPSALAELRRAGWSGPILALTASTDEASRLACERAGFDETLTKPIDRDTLRSACARWLGARDKPAQAA